ncbi:MAG TPA: GNAT family N-acetyltransferase [Nitriliruptorales bacterium]
MANEGLADAVRDFLQMEIVAIGHIAPHGDAHASNHAILAHTSAPSVFNRGTAVDLSQPDVALAEVESFFGDLPHTLWLEADLIDRDADGLLRGRGYIPMPNQHGVATTRMPDGRGQVGSHLHAMLQTEPADAAGIADVSATGFGLGVDDRLFFEDLARAILRHAKPWQHGAIYGIRRDGRLVSVGSLLCTAHAAGISALATMPMHRHHGHGTTIATRALHDAAALGFTVAVSVATPDSAKLFEALGFEPVIDYHVYRQTRP